MIRKSSFLPVRRVIDLLRSTSSARLIPSGVSSNAQLRINATGNPMTGSKTTSRIAQFGISKMGRPASRPESRATPRRRRRRPLCKRCAFLIHRRISSDPLVFFFSPFFVGIGTIGPFFFSRRARFDFCALSLSELFISARARRRVFESADHSGADQTSDRAGAARE